MTSASGNAKTDATLAQTLPGVSVAEGPGGLVTLAEHPDLAPPPQGGMAEHADAPNRKLLGALLVEAELITEQQLHEALTEQAESGDKLGSILIKRGYVPKHVIGQMLSVQQRLGRILVERGYVPKHIIGQLLEEQQGVSYVSLTGIEVDVELLRSIPQSLILEHKVLPLARRGDVVHLAMVDPTDIVAMDRVALITGARIKPLLTTEADHAWAVSKFLDLQSTIAERMGDFDIAPPDDEMVAIRVSESPYDPPVVRLVDSLVQNAIRESATDIHIEPQADETLVRYRIDGMLHDKVKLSGGVAGAVASRIKVISGLDIAERVRPQDGRILLSDHGREYDLRVATVGSVFGERVVIRLLDKSRVLRGLEHLGLLPDQEGLMSRLLDKPYGMIPITGPTGSGKTTTLYACISRINQRSRNIMTVEDPVEYHLPGITQLPVRPKMGITFAVGLRAIMRQDPDVIMVGEIRDSETAQMAVQAALTGHLVQTTLHANDAAGAVVRLIDMGVEPYLIISSLLAVVSQRLVRTLCDCKAVQPMNAALLHDLGADAAGIPEVFTPVGCPQCHYLGYRGRIGIFEIMPVTKEIRELILGRQPATVIKAAAQSAGMRTMRACGIAKAQQGITSMDEIRRLIFKDVE